LAAFFLLLTNAVYIESEGARLSSRPTKEE